MSYAIHNVRKSGLEWLSVFDYALLRGIVTFYFDLIYFERRQNNLYCRQCHSRTPHIQAPRDWVMVEKQNIQAK